MWTSKNKFKKRGKMNEYKFHFIHLRSMKSAFEQEKAELKASKHHRFLIVHVIKLIGLINRLYKKYETDWIDYAWKHDLDRSLWGKMAKKL